MICYFIYLVIFVTLFISLLCWFRYFILYNGLFNVLYLYYKTEVSP